ncbi:hypothetical protein RM572_02595 [Streptomyces sp. DSM 42041]|uniref:Transposase n=1 Tax=Streptomyces hazeniae TaxID=3075538 RepID=A0ABU2NM38_9ACTN|nr:hypothetical protein [Streptomyces sp. DSM 42041]MDT0377661.1 hypothetical protein [Streptomyces sp. DSM 42041]
MPVVGRRPHGPRHRPTGEVRPTVNLEAVADELYALRPSAFTATRDARAREARRAGDRDLATRISALRRPTLAAWAANLLVREHAEETARFLALGEQLRRAYQDLDGGRLRELARTQRELIRALARSALDSAAASGQSLGEGARREVEQTLQAVLADPDAADQWSAGHLATSLTPPTDFSSTGLPAAGPGRAPARTSTRPAKERSTKERSAKERPAKVADLDRARDRRRRREEEADEARRAAEQAAGEAAEEARRAEEERVAADDALARAKERSTAADRRLTAARDELRDAEREQQAAADAERDAHTRAQDASRGARAARRSADRATREADRRRSGPRTR